MWASAIVKGQISTNADAGFGHGLVGVEVDLLVFDRPPKAFHEDIVPPSALAIHRDGDFGFLQHCNKDDLIAACMEERDQPNLMLFKRWFCEAEGALNF